MTKKTLLIFLIISLSGSNNLYPRIEENPIHTADRLMDLLNFEQAIHYYTQVIEDNPNTKGVRLSLGYAYFQLKKYGDALRVLDEELIFFPDNYNAYLLLGYVYFNLNKFEEAAEACRVHDNYIRAFIEERALKNLKKENPNLGLPNFILGVYYKKKGNFSDSMINFHLALERGYNPIHCYLQMINTELTEKKWIKGLKKTQEALKTQGLQSEFYFMMGYIYHQMKEIEKAAYCFEKAIQLKPYLMEAKKNLALIYFNEEEFEKASRLLRKIIKMTPFDFNSRYYLERILRKEGITQKEKDKLKLTKDIVDSVQLEYKYTLKNDVRFIRLIINNTALSMVRMGKLEDAVCLFRDYLKIEHSSPEINYNLGQLYNILGRLDKALQYALRAVELKNDFKDGHDLIGNIFFKLREFQNSLLAYKKVVEIDAKDALGYYNLGCIYSAMKDFDEAEKFWKKAIKYNKGIKRKKERGAISEDGLEISLIVLEWPVSFRAHRSLGFLYIEKNLSAKALKEFEKAIKLEPDDPASYYELGKIYQAKKDKKKAIFYYEKYLYLGGKEKAKVDKILNSLKK